MAISKSMLASVALLAALGACATTTDAPPAAVADAGVYVGKSVLDAAIETAGGEAALSKVKEIYVTGLAKVTVDGATTEQNVALLVRPFGFYRLTSWAKGAEPKTAKTVQAELGQAWDVTRVTWQPMGDAAAKFENEQLGLYSAILLAPLKGQGISVKEMPVANDGGRGVTVSHGEAQPVELSFDVNGKLVGALYSGTDPKAGTSTVDTATFSGEVVSNGVKWPKHITFARDGRPAYEIEVATFEALPNKTVRPLEQAMQYEGGAPPSDDDAG